MTDVISTFKRSPSWGIGRGDRLEHFCIQHMRFRHQITSTLSDIISRASPPNLITSVDVSCSILEKLTDFLGYSFVKMWIYVLLLRMMVTRLLPDTSIFSVVLFNALWPISGSSCARKRDEMFLISKLRTEPYSLNKLISVFLTFGVTCSSLTSSKSFLFSCFTHILFVYACFLIIYSVLKIALLFVSYYD